MVLSGSAGVGVSLSAEHEDKRSPAHPVRESSRRIAVRFFIKVSFRAVGFVRPGFRCQAPSVELIHDDRAYCSPHPESRIKQRKRGAEDYFSSEVLEDLGDKISNSSTPMSIKDTTQEDCLFSLQLNFPDSTARINLHFRVICCSNLSNIFGICKDYLPFPELLRR